MRARADQDRRFRELYERFFPRVLSIFVNRGISLEDAQDLAQETYLRFYRTMDTIDIENEEFYLVRVAKNVWANHIRYKITAKRRSIEVPIEAEIDTASYLSAETSPEDKLIMAERSKILKCALSDLSDIQRRAVLLSFDGFRYKEIAKNLGTSLNNVKVAMYRAKKRLAEKIAQESP